MNLHWPIIFILVVLICMTIVTFLNDWRLDEIEALLELR